jgi:hypothetical protein
MLHKRRISSANGTFGAARLPVLRALDGPGMALLPFGRSLGIESILREGRTGESRRALSRHGADGSTVVTRDGSTVVELARDVWPAERRRRVVLLFLRRAMARLLPGAGNEGDSGSAVQMPRVRGSA